MLYDSGEDYIACRSCFRLWQEILRRVRWNPSHSQPLEIQKPPPQCMFELQNWLSRSSAVTPRPGFDGLDPCVALAALVPENMQE